MATRRNGLALVYDAFRPPEQMTCSEWATRYRRLSLQESRRQGRWRHSVTPYLVGMMDAFSNLTTRSIVVCKSAQMGGTDAMINMLGYAVGQDPGPGIWVYPSRSTDLARFKVRLQHLSSSTPQIAQARTGDRWDQTMISFRWRDMTLWLASSKTPAGLGTVPCRYAWGDEIDKWDRWTGREGAPLGLLSQRLETYRGIEKMVLVSTPTMDDTGIWREYQLTHKLKWYCPCPNCGWYQELVWPQVHGLPGPDRKSGVKEAYYRCINQACEGRHDDTARYSMIDHGMWVEDGTDPSPDVQGDPMTDPALGFHISRLLSKMHKLEVLAREFVAAKPYPEKLMNFRNNVQALPWEQAVGGMDMDAIRKRYIGSYSMGTIPEGCLALTAGVDVHDLDLRYVIWGWGKGGRGWLIKWGRINSEARRHDWGLLNEVLARGMADKKGVMIAPCIVGVDTAWQTDEVYQWILTNPGVLHATKGDGTFVQPYRAISQKDDPSLGGMMLYHINDAYYKDLILGRLTLAADDARVQQFPSDTTEDFWAEFTAEHKTFTVNKGTGEQKYAWRVRDGAVGNHYLDCSKLAFWAADYIGLWEMDDPGAFGRARVEPVVDRTEESAGTWAGGIRSNWMGGIRRGRWM